MAWDATPGSELHSRWDGNYFSVQQSSGKLWVWNDYRTNLEPTYLKSKRMQKFQATFSLRWKWSGSTGVGASLYFNGTDRDDWDCISVFSEPTGNLYGPGGYSMINGIWQGWKSLTSSNNPAATYSTVMWNRIQFDGTTLKVWQIAGTSTAPSESDWTAIVSSPEVSTTSFRTTGGRIGLGACIGHNDAWVGDFTLKSWDTSTSAFDITEATEDFSEDGSGYANTNTSLASDNNGNQTYDGVNAYTYDAWNHLITAAHAYRDSGGTLHEGQVMATTAYDGLGRRISKTVNGTGQWDGTLNYYLDGDSVVEEQNGSAMTLKQFIWGTQYIDDLVQVSLNSAPASQSTCDTPYFAMCDSNWNVLGLVNSSGVLSERYEYDAYGKRQVFMSAGTNDPACYSPTMGSQRMVTSGSVTQFYGLNEVGFQGLMHDEESGLIVTPHRYLQPGLGRWLTRDPISDVGAEMLAGGSDLDAIEASNDPVTLDAAGAAAVRTWVALGRAHAMDVSLWQYADGMSLYQDVKGNPETGLDPSGMANTAPGRNGGTGYMPCPKNHDRLTCMSNCIDQNDPLNLLAKGLLTGAGGPIPKALINAFGGRTVGVGGPDVSPFTTIPSEISKQMRLGGRSGLRLLGRTSFWAWLAYADYMAGVETHCLGAYAGDPCAY